MSNLKEELIQLIGIHLKDYTWKIDENCKDELWIIINRNNKDYQMYINVYETWEQTKKRIELNIEEQIRECEICNEVQRLLFCEECLNQHCYFCHAHIVIKNKGTPVCPFCRDGEDLIHLNTPYNNILKKHRYDFALKLIETKI